MEHLTTTNIKHDNYINKVGLIPIVSDASINKLNSMPGIDNMYYNEINDNTQFFVNKELIPFSTIKQHNVNVITAPLKGSGKFDLIGISQNENLLSEGIVDITDCLRANISFENIYILIPEHDNIPNIIIKYKLDKSDHNKFSTINSNDRNYSYHKLIHISLDNNTIDIYGNPINKYGNVGTILIHIECTAYLWIETASIEYHMKIMSTLDLYSNSILPVKTIMLIGTDLEGYRDNNGVKYINPIEILKK